MIEITVKDYLENALGVEVYAMLPPKHGETWVTVERTGGTDEFGKKTARLAIQSNAPTLYETIRLNDRVINEMLWGLIRLITISRVELNSTYNYTDTDDKQPRYQAVFDIVHF